MFKIDPLAPAADILRVNDVVLEIEGVRIADDGTVEFRNEERVEFSHIVRSKHIGGMHRRLYMGSHPQLGARHSVAASEASTQHERHPPLDTFVMHLALWLNVQELSPDVGLICEAYDQGV